VPSTEAGKFPGIYPLNRTAKTVLRAFGSFGSDPAGVYGGEIFGALPASTGRTMKGRPAAFIVVCMPHIMNSADVIRMLKADGWEEVATRGSHH